MVPVVYSKWASQFGCFLQYTSGLEVLACSLNTNFNYVTTPTAPSLEPLNKVAETFRGKMLQLFGCVLIERYVTHQHSLLNLRLSAKMFWQNA